MKDKIVAVRVNELLQNEIDRISQKNEVSKSKITRAALEKYLYIYGNPFPIILWGRNEFTFALNCLNDSQIEELAEISVQNGLKAKYLFIKNFLKKEEPENYDLSARNIVDILVKSVFTSEGQNWFNKIKSIWKGDWVMITGLHEVGTKFSLYIKHTFIKHLEPYSFKLIKEDLQDKSITLEFKKQEGIE